MFLSPQIGQRIVFVKRLNKLVDMVRVNMWHDICGKYSGAFVSRQKNPPNLWDSLASR